MKRSIFVLIMLIGFIFTIVIPPATCSTLEIEDKITILKLVVNGEEKESYIVANIHYFNYFGDKSVEFKYYNLTNAIDTSGKNHTIISNIEILNTENNKVNNISLSAGKLRFMLSVKDVTSPWEVNIDYDKSRTTKQPLGRVNIVVKDKVLNGKAISYLEVDKIYLLSNTLNIYENVPNIDNDKTLRSLGLKN